MGGLWFALMEGPPVSKTYNHIAFSVEETSLPLFKDKIETLGLEMLPSRSRFPQEGSSLYFYDYDHHLFELHSGDLETRLKFYAETSVVIFSELRE